jgi:hypothetical protein
MTPKQAIVELAADSRQVSPRYSGLCAAIPNAEDGVSSANPMGFTFQEPQSVLPVVIMIKPLASRKVNRLFGGQELHDNMEQPGRLRAQSGRRAA